MAKIWRGQEKKTLFLTLTSKCDLDLGATDLGLAHKIHQGMAKLWTGKEKKDPIFDL